MRYVPIVAGLLVVVLGAGVAEAAKKKTAAPKKQATPAASTSSQLPGDELAASSAAQDANTAKDALDKASKDYQSKVDQLTKDFESGADFTAAQKALSDAGAALETAKAPVIAKVKATSAYAAADKAQTKAQDKLDQLKRDNAGDDQIQAAAAKVFEASQAGSRLINDALAADTNVAAAQKVFDEASAKVGKMRADFKTSLTTNTDLTALKQTRDDAQNKYNDSLTKLNTANAKVASDKRRGG